MLFNFSQRFCMKILIIKTSSLGDIVQSYPVIDYLQKHFPSAEIDWVVEERAESLISCHPFLSKPLMIDTKKWKKGIFKKENWREAREFISQLREKDYDVVFDLQGNFKSSLILAFVKAKKKVGFLKPAERINRLFTHVKFETKAGQSIHNDYLELVQRYFNDSAPLTTKAFSMLLTDEERTKLNEITKRLPKQYCVLVAPSATWPNKELSPQTLIQVLKKLNEQRDCYFLFLSSNEREHAIATEFYSHFMRNSERLESLSIALLQNVMSKMNLIIAMDSLPLHLAATTKRPCFGFFGPSLATKYLLPESNSGFYQGECPYGLTFEKRCKKLRSCKSGACLKEKNAHELFFALCDFLDRI